MQLVTLLPVLFWLTKFHFMKYIENERLPTELGWKRPATAFTTDILLASLDKVAAEYGKQLNSSTAATARKSKRGGGERYSDRIAAYFTGALS